MTILEYIGSIGGVGGVLAFLIFMAYRYLVRQMRDDRKYWEERLAKILDRYDETATKNTAVLTELIVWLKAKNGGK